MNRQPTQHSRWAQGSFRGQLEALEKRLCPSCNALQTGASLFITGANASNHVVVQQDDEGYHVTCDGGSMMTFRGIERAMIRTGQGNDSVDAFYGTGVYKAADLQ